MSKYVLMNRRAGSFTDEQKTASRAAVASVMATAKPMSNVLHDNNPADPLARRVIVLDADSDYIASLHATLPPSTILEPLIRRQLHIDVPIELTPTAGVGVQAAGPSVPYSVLVRGAGEALAGIEVMIYLQSPAGATRIAKVRTDAEGQATANVPAGSSVSFVEPIPYSGFWIMLMEAPPSGATIECVPIAGQQASGAWWHTVMGIDVTSPSRGKGIKVGVIDTGCGPHPNLSKVHLVGAFVDNGALAPDQARDVAEHGTHTTGIIGAKPAKAGEYAGMAPDCDLFHARVFKGEGEGDGPSQADIVNAIDALSRDKGCDLINMSLGGGPPSQAEQDAIRDAAERGTLCICSAGNEGGAIDYPGAYPECVAVSAIGRIGWAPSGTFSAGNRPHVAAKLGQNQLFLATFSCFGLTLTCAGPGVGIVSTVPAKAGLAAPYMEMDGTSMASPAVCGALAVFLSKDAHYQSLPRDKSRSDAARSILEQHCRSFGLAVQYEGRGLPKE